MPLGGAAIPVWQRSEDEDQALVAHWRLLFKQADIDGNGVIDKDELVTLLNKTNKGLRPVTLDWLSQMAIAKANQATGASDPEAISFREYCVLMQDGLLVEGKLQEYMQAFDAVDTSGNGLIGANEIQDLFHKLGQPIKSDKVANIMTQYDIDGSGQIEFSEFLDMFSNDLLDLQAMQEYVNMQPKPHDAGTHTGRIIEPKPGRVTMFFGEEELDFILSEFGQRLVVVEASMTWCRPCKGFERAYERFASVYEQVLFTKFFGNANDNTKHIFTTRFQIPKTPTFLFLRQGTVVHRFNGASKEKMEEALQSFLLPEENPVAGASQFKMQVWRSKLGIQ